MATGPSRISPASTEPVDVVDGFLKRNSSKNSRWGPSGRHHPADIPQAGTAPLFPPVEGDLPNAAARRQMRDEVRQLLEAFLSREQGVLGQTASASLPFPARTEVAEEPRRSSVTLPRIDVKLREKPGGSSEATSTAWVPPRPASYIQAVGRRNIPSPGQQKAMDKSPTSASPVSSMEDNEYNDPSRDSSKPRKKKSLYQRAKERLRMSLRRDQAGHESQPAHGSQHDPQPLHRHLHQHHADSLPLPQASAGRSSGLRDGPQSPPPSKPRKHDTRDRHGGRSSADERHHSRANGGAGGEDGAAAGGSAAAAEKKASKKKKKEGKLPSRSASITATFERLRSSLMRKTSRAGGKLAEDRVKNVHASEPASKLELGVTTASRSQGSAMVHTSEAAAVSTISHYSDASTVPDKEALYKKVAERLAKIADAYVPSIGMEEMETVESDGAGSSSAAAARPSASAAELALEQKLAAALCAKVDQLSESVTAPTDVMRQMVEGMVYSEFSRVVDETLPQAQPEAQQLALLFRLTEGAIRLAGSGAAHIKDHTLQYIEDNFARWIYYGGGWDSMLEDSDFEID